MEEPRNKATLGISMVSVVRIKIHLFCQFQVVEENLVRLEACMLEEHLLGEQYVTHAQYTVTLFILFV